MIAPGRARRPGTSAARIAPPSDEELETCPFCSGREDRTPPESLRIGEPWSVRVVPNLYPAFDHQEVVVHSPRHVRSFAELHDFEVEAVAEAWRRRGANAREKGFAYVHALINEGEGAGASLFHSHSQLVWLRKAPPIVLEERKRPGGAAELLRSIRHGPDAAGLELELLDDVVAICHPAGRVPYETLILNGAVRDEDVFASDRALPLALLTLRNVIRRLRAVEGAVPWNAWLHAGDDWHLEVVPRLTVLAGVELGAGIFVNALAPEEAAKRLRDAVPVVAG